MWLDVADPARLVSDPDSGRVTTRAGDAPPLWIEATTASLPDPWSSGPIPTELLLHVDDRAPIPVVRDTLDRGAHGGLVWTGRPVGDPEGLEVLAQRNGVWWGRLTTLGQTWELHGSHLDGLVVEEVAYEATTTEGGCGTDDGAVSSATPGPLAASASLSGSAASAQSHGATLGPTDVWPFHSTCPDAVNIPDLPMCGADDGITVDVAVAVTHGALRRNGMLVHREEALTWVMAMEAWSNAILVQSGAVARMRVVDVLVTDIGQVNACDHDTINPRFLQLCLRDPTRDAACTPFAAQLKTIRDWATGLGADAFSFIWQPAWPSEYFADFGTSNSSLGDGSGDFHYKCAEADLLQACGFTTALPDIWSEGSVRQQCCEDPADFVDNQPRDAFCAPPLNGSFERGAAGSGNWADEGTCLSWYGGRDTFVPNYWMSGSAGTDTFAHEFAHLLNAKHARHETTAQPNRGFNAAWFAPDCSLSTIMTGGNVPDQLEVTDPNPPFGVSSQPNPAFCVRNDAGNNEVPTATSNLLLFSSSCLTTGQLGVRDGNMPTTRALNPDQSYHESLVPLGDECHDNARMISQMAPVLASVSPSVAIDPFDNRSRILSPDEVPLYLVPGGPPVTTLMTWSDPVGNLANGGSVWIQFAASPEDLEDRQNSSTAACGPAQQVAGTSTTITVTVGCEHMRIWSQAQDSNGTWVWVHEDHWWGQSGLVYSAGTQVPKLSGDGDLRNCSDFSADESRATRASVVAGILPWDSLFRNTQSDPDSGSVPCGGVCKRVTDTQTGKPYISCALGGGTQDDDLKPWLVARSDPREEALVHHVIYGMALSANPDDPAQRFCCAYRESAPAYGTALRLHGVDIEGSLRGDQIHLRQCNGAHLRGMPGIEFQVEVRGRRGPDTMWGSSAPPPYFEHFYGDKERDVLHMGAGNDFADGGEGDDNVHGGGGADESRGGEGADVVCDEDGLDVLDGDAGDDLVRWFGLAGGGQVAGGTGSDVCYGTGAADTTCEVIWPIPFEGPADCMEKNQWP